MSNSIGDTASFDFFDDGGQAAIFNALAANDFESENSSRRQVGHAASLLEVADSGGHSGGRHMLGQDHATDHLGAVAVGLPCHRMSGLRERIISNVSGYFRGGMGRRGLGSRERGRQKEADRGRAGKLTG